MGSENKDYYALNNLIEEILLNAAFCNLYKVPPHQVKVIMGDLLSTFSDYLKYEINHPDLIDMMLQRNAFCAPNGSIIDFLGGKQERRGEAVASKEESVIFGSKEHGLNMKSLENLVEVFERSLRYLNILKYLLNSKVFLQEISDQEELLYVLTKLLVSKSPFISLLAGLVIKACSHHYSGNESKAEQINKRVLIRGCKYEPEGAQQAEYALAASGQRPRLLNSIFEYLRYFEILHDKDHLTKSLHLASINLILTSILHDRQSSTAREDLELFARSVSESQIVEDEKAMNKPVFQLIDKFSLFGAEYFDI